MGERKERKKEREGRRETQFSLRALSDGERMVVMVMVVESELPYAIGPMIWYSSIYIKHLNPSTYLSYLPTYSPTHLPIPEKFQLFSFSSPSLSCAIIPSASHDPITPYLHDSLSDPLIPIIS